MKHLIACALLAATAACSSSAPIQPIDVTVLDTASGEAAIADALQAPGIGLKDVSVTPAMGNTPIWITGSWQLSPGTQQDWATIGDNAYKLARATLKDSPGKLVINVSHPSGASLTQFNFSPSNAEALVIKSTALAKAIVKAPVESAALTPFCNYLAGYASVGATSPAYSACPQ